MQGGIVVVVGVVVVVVVGIVVVVVDDVVGTLDVGVGFSMQSPDTDSTSL